MRDQLTATTRSAPSGRTSLGDRVRQRYPLREAAQAHRDLEARRTTGSTILLP